MDSLPLEIIWIIMEFLLPSDWLHFGIAYDRAYKCILNPNLNSKYKLRFKKFCTFKDDMLWKYYYHAFSNGKRDGTLISINNLGSHVIKNYSNDRLHGVYMQYFTFNNEFIYNYYIYGEAQGISIHARRRKIKIVNYRNNSKYGLEINFRGSNLIKITNH